MVNGISILGCTGSIGRQTAAEAEKYGMKTFIADEATLDSLVKKIEEIGEENE